MTLCRWRFACIMSAGQELSRTSDQPRRLTAPAGNLPDGPSPQASNGLTHLTDRELFERLGWFISIRWVVGIVALLLVLVGRYRFNVCIPPRPVVQTICVLFMYNAFFLLLVIDAYRRKRVSRRFIVGCANAQITCDLITLAVLMHFTGGVENAFLIFFICPMIIAGQLLSPRNAYAHAAMGTLLINGVAWSEYGGVLPHVPVGESLGVTAYHCPLMVTEFTVALSCLLFAVVFLQSTIASRLRQRELELEDAYKHLQEVEEAKSFVMLKTSHELRAPLNAVVAMFQAIAAESVSECGPALRDFINRAVKRTLSLSKLVDELHRYATLRDARTAIVKEPVDFAEMVRQAVDMFAPMAREKQLNLTSHIEPGWIHGDPQAITELVGNLIVNAIQYTPPGGDIHVRLEHSQATVQFEVRDSGIGIPPEDLERVFVEFYRTRTAKKTFPNGTGMGLPIVKRIIQAHGGTIRVHSEVGKGTSFIVTFVPAGNIIQSSPPKREASE